MIPRPGIALPAALAAVVILAGIAALANISAMSALRESVAIRELATTRATSQTVRARALYQIARHPRSELLSSIGIGAGDTTLAITPLTWPWHIVSVQTAGARVFAEVARALIVPVPWCAPAVYAGVADVATGALEVPAPSSCTHQEQVTPAEVARFDSALVATAVGLQDADTLIVATSASDVLRARRTIVLADGADVAGLIIAPVVRVMSGARVRGIVIAADSLWIASGALVTADGNAVIAALSDRARVSLMGRRGMILP